MTTENSNNTLPDIAITQSSSNISTLNWVGMSNIALPIHLEVANEIQSFPAQIDTFVNLISNDKGIHMSRLYKHCIEHANQALSPNQMNQWISSILNSHKELSNQAKLKVKFDLLLKQSSLLSDNFGWNKYPCTISATKKEDSIEHEILFKVLYSSTCPCSTSLAKQLLANDIENQFPNDFNSKDINEWLKTYPIPTPHSQRSEATISIKQSSSSSDFPLEKLITSIEDILGTPVQTMVKREDEQAFAKNNGLNLMFCEDAARKIKYQLDENSSILDYYIHVRHIESLHAHDAISICFKGVKEGYSESTSLEL